MGTFQILDHTADVGILAEGETLGEVFVQAARGMFSVILRGGEVGEGQNRSIALEAPDVEALLVEWLNELLYLFDRDGLVMSRFQIDDIGCTFIKAHCYGEIFDEVRHQIGTGVKSATYHMLKVRKNRLWQARVFLDI